jgi:conserved oligomeric Golgi complex subunit 5
MIYLSLSLASNPGRTTMPSVGNTPQFRALLWTNIEKILDLLYNYVAQLSNLTKVLSKKKDPITHGSFIDELVKVTLVFDALSVLMLSTVCCCSTAIQENWSASSGWARWKPCESSWNHRSLVGSRRYIDQQEIISRLCADSFHLRQALEGEYPKLLKLQNDVIHRLNQLQPGFSELDMDLVDEENTTNTDSDQYQEKQKFVSSSIHWPLDRCLRSFRTNVQLNECFDIFEKSYLSISLSRLSDPINLMFSSTTTKPLPNQQELENLIKVMIK